jgi:hypothetical protein
VASRVTGIQWYCVFRRKMPPGTRIVSATSGILIS